MYCACFLMNTKSSLKCCSNYGGGAIEFQKNSKPLLE